MSRRPRFELPGVPLHIVQRGNNRQPTFHDDEDRFNYLRLAIHASGRHGANIHAYALMQNHIHLLLSAPEGSASRFMHDLGSAYVGWFNHRHARSGTLWEGRFRSCLVDTDRYLWNCHRYVEFNPVRAGLCDLPEQYVWSSYRANALGVDDRLISPHASYLALAKREAARCLAYRALVTAAVVDEIFANSRLRSSRSLGTEAFDQSASIALGQPVEGLRRGRPRSEGPCGTTTLFPGTGENWT